jgi:hypothetical protein
MSRIDISYNDNTKSFNISLALQNYIDKLIKIQAENQDFAKWDLTVSS